MGNYLQNLRNKPDFRPLESLLPKGFCPLLFYNLTPYLYTLSRGGSFDWIKRTQDVSVRREITDSDFVRKDLNRIYTNEVLVRCPNPLKNVVAGIGLWPHGKIKIRFVHLSTGCPNNHRVADEYLLDREDSGQTALEYNSLFPETLSLCMTGRTADSHLIDKRRVSVSVSRIVFPCRYHPSSHFSTSSLLPEDFCPDVFALIYPRILSVMYHARTPDNFSIDHPGNRGQVVLSVRKTSLLKRPVKAALGVARKIFESIFYPIDIIDYDVVITVLKNEDGDCHLKKGASYHVNLRDRNFLCPSSFHVLYPFLLLSGSGTFMQWGETRSNDLLPCPDCIGAVYSLGREIA